MKKLFTIIAVALGLISGLTIGIIFYQYAIDLYYRLFESKALLHSLTIAGDNLVPIFISIPFLVLSLFFVNIFIYILPCTDEAKNTLIQAGVNWTKVFFIAFIVLSFVFIPIASIAALNSYEVYEDKVILYSPLSPSGTSYRWSDIDRVSVHIDWSEAGGELNYNLYTTDGRLVSLVTWDISICSVVKKVHPNIARYPHIINNSHFSLEASNKIKEKCRK